MTKFICIASGKGGVGKTTAVVNIGTALSRFGYNTVIIDANISTPNLSLHLNLPKTGKTLHDVLKDKADVFEAMYSQSSGIKVMPGSLSLWGLKSINKYRMDYVLSKIKGTCDVALLDCSSGVGEDATSAISSADEMFIVTNPSLPALTDALKTIELARSVGTFPKGVILNMQKDKKYELSKSNVEEFLGLPVIEAIPEDDAVRKSLNKRQSVIDLYPNNKASIAFMKAAAKMMGEEYEDLTNKGIRRKLRNWFFKKDL